MNVLAFALISVTGITKRGGLSARVRHLRGSTSQFLMADARVVPRPRRFGIHVGEQPAGKHYAQTDGDRVVSSPGRMGWGCLFHPV